MFVVDGFHRMVRPSMGGGTELDKLLPFLLAVFSKASWCYTVDSAAVRYLFALHGNVISTPVLVPRWTELQIREYIESKCRTVGIEFDVSDFRVPRHLELGRGKEGGDRRRRGFYRLLWHASEGNPASAVEVFVLSLRTGRGRELFVREIREPPVEDLEQQSLKTLLILKFIIQCEYATAEEISRGLGFSRTLVDVALASATANQWIIRTDDRYRVSLRWFRTLTAYLKRRNLISGFASED